MADEKKRMKKLFTFILILFCGQLSAQDKFATYESDFFKKTHEIQISSEKEGKYKLYIDITSTDRVHEKVGLILNQKTHPKFISSLNTAKLKYAEWCKTAKENNVDDLDKQMDIKNGWVDGYFQYGNDWHFDYMVGLTFEFKVSKTEADEILYLLIVRTTKLTASDNRFMDVDGGILVFKAEKEIEEFVSTMSLEKIAAYASRPKASELFK